MICSKEKIEYGKQVIEFNLYQEDRKTLSINILPNSDIKIKAPLNKNKNEILKKVQMKAKWINKQQKYFEQNYIEPIEKEYVSGETHLYLGRQYRLKVKKSDKNSIKLKNGYFFIESLNDNKIIIKSLLKNWYKKKAIKIYNERLNICYDKFKKFNIEKPDLKIRQLKKRWGSYNKNNNTIVLNSDCIKANKNCIDYIICHELCHCIYYSHDKMFYELLSKFCPEWQKTKEKLEKFII